MIIRNIKKTRGQLLLSPLARQLRMQNALERRGVGSGGQMFYKGEVKRVLCPLGTSDLAFFPLVEFYHPVECCLEKD